MAIKLIKFCCDRCVFDVLERSVLFIKTKRDINIYVAPIERYLDIEGVKNINIWNFEFIVPNINAYKKRQDRMEMAIKDKNVRNIFCFDLNLTKKFNHKKVKYFPLGYIEEMVVPRINSKKENKICFLGNLSERRKKLFYNKKIDVFDVLNYESIQQTTRLLSNYRFGIDTHRADNFVDLYVNCLRVSQYIMAGNIIVTDNCLESFGIDKNNYIYTKLNKPIIPNNISGMAEGALNNLKKNVNMKKIFLDFDL